LGTCRQRLSKDELEWFARASEEALRATRNLADVLEGIGCLVAADDDDTGSFQSGESISRLLFHVAHSLDHIGALIHIGDFATDRLLMPELYRMSAKVGLDKSA
jgi:hypothetical protein